MGENNRVLAARKKAHEAKASLAAANESHH